MKSNASPQIGFDRYIQLDWVQSALRVRAGYETMEQLTHLIDGSHSGAAAKKKTRTVLNRLWLEPRSDLRDLCDRAIDIYRSDPSTSVATLTWGMAIATYPFFGAVAEIVGRLLRLHGECSSAEVHRRMAEIYGEREGTRRMTNMVLQSQASWGAVERERQGKKIIGKAGMLAMKPATETWLTEAVLRYSRRAIPLTSLPSLPVLYPFKFDEHLAYSLSHSNKLAIKVDSASNRIVELL
ncbi:MAG: hypothetical protein O9253_00970 [Aquidulcibacter sp.]|jgi:hypothetical protein|nr:hypothetical protein [Aquidulcibacter sp.]